MMVKCSVCGNVYGSPPRWPGDKCLVRYSRDPNRCQGELKPFIIPSFVRCSECGNVFGNPPHQIGDLCPMPHCGKVLVAYRH
jgi:ribosomal protein S27E